ncbi:CerR family C-terminal domain-containing protein [Paracoccus sp. PAR01]|uniref:CerR family C-terminal domain-containing protein n=1 Tax=Paracoccus sp. PAR01 TaxID=2769282 RepID=UPI00178337CD|nr:CerR family C-terminal domain-containing protein [Paracoccus sp. PAR01]MBD9528583.1 CerR family C-terminal domain-containing protein [Paracoccus sp. PAR01]
MTSLRRRNAESGYARGEETRAKIIQTAITLFGEKGFAGVSTREIAGAAGVPAPSIQYYFENKEGLYQACVDNLHMSAWEAVGPVIAAVETLLADKADSDRLIDGYCRILERLADFLFAMPDAGSRALFVAQHRALTNWQKSTPSGQQATGRRIQDCCAAVVARIADGRLSSEDSKIVSTTVNGQLMIVHLARDHVEDMLGWTEITSARNEALKSVVRRQTTLLLNSYRSG